MYLDRDGVGPATGSRLRLPGVAATYRRVLAQAEAAGSDRDRQLEAARDAWYRGFVAEALDRFCATTRWSTADGGRYGGLLRADDLANWEPSVEAPARWSPTTGSLATGPLAGIEVLKPGPWSQGPVLLQQLSLLEAAGLVGEPVGADVEALHTLLECQKLAFADRQAWYGDPVVSDVPIAALLDPGYARQRLALLDPDRADRTLRPGSPAGRVPQLPELADYDSAGRPTAVRVAPREAVDPVSGVPLAAPGEPTGRRADGPPRPGRGDTCHVDVVDATGLMVAATPSGGWLQSSPVVPALGFPLGTRAQMFWLTPSAARLTPGARPRTTLSPSMVLREGRPWLAFGTPGGDQQDQWGLVLLLRLLADAAAGRAPGLQAAVDAPILHGEHPPSSFHPRRAAPARVVAESRWPATFLAALTRLGHDVVTVPGWSLGRLSAVARDPAAQGGWLRAAADARGAQGYAAGR